MGVAGGAAVEEGVRERQEGEEGVRYLCGGRGEARSWLQGARSSNGRKDLASQHWLLEARCRLSGIVLHCICYLFGGRSRHIPGSIAGCLAFGLEFCIASE